MNPAAPEAAPAARRTPTPSARRLLALAAALAIAVQAAPAGAQQATPLQYEEPRAGLIAAGAGLATVGVAGLVTGVLLLRGSPRPSRTRSALGSGAAVLGGILLPLGLSLAASGTQRIPEGTTVPRDDSQMVTGGLLATVGGAALGGGIVLVTRQKRQHFPAGVALMAVGNGLMAVGMPLWVHGAYRVPASAPVGEQADAARRGRPLGTLRLARAPF
jgi:hypothetical protein